MSEGWIKVHRQIQDCEIWDSDEPYDYRSAWIYLLLMANHRDKDIMFNRKPMTIKRGQFLTSIRKLAEHWGWSKVKTASYLSTLEELQMIKKESDNTRTLLTIIKYEIYQGDTDTNEDTNQDTHKDTDKTPISHKQECKNVRKKEIYIKADETPVFIELPLNDGSTHSVTEKVVCELKELYPSADVEQELRNMKGWLNGNPTKRKTKTGINRFINSWLAREQNKGGKVTPVKKSNSFAEINKPGFDESALEKMLGV